MSVKSIELQIAIPKTFEAGKIAEQKQQQSQINQQHANALTEKQALKNKESVLESAPYAKLDADDKQPNDPSEQKKKNSRKSNSESSIRSKARLSTVVGEAIWESYWHFYSSYKLLVSWSSRYCS
ncbi:hypothetical protein [Sporosarcina sp. P13]|uniref:hypothetical protein n=1 Tax=Sporosarcina sp. P13 TaxID=2048263 RepID=UPI001E3318A3|nr:hypothetical protein [Sporosarcina sp. P13]